MARTYTWSDSVPLGSVSSGSIDDEIRKLRVEIRELLNQLMGVAEGTALADPIIAATKDNDSLDTRIAAFETTQTYTKTIAGVCAKVYTTTSAPAVLFGSPPALVISETDHGSASFVIFELDLPVGVTITTVTAYVAFSGAGNIAATFRNSAVSGATFGNTTIDSTTLSGGATVWNLTDTTTVAGRDYYIMFDLNPVGGTEVITVYGITVTYTSPTANVRR
jgi:hypothetical protein